MACALSVLALAVYLANGREIGQYDTEPATLLTIALLRGEGLHLDRFKTVLHESDGRLSPFVARSGRHIVSRYPVAPAILALPVVAPQVWYRDAVAPGWDRNPLVAWSQAKVMGKRAAAVLTAITVGLIFLLSRTIVPTRFAAPAALTAAFGSNLWAVASQALWQHGPATLMLTTAALLLTRERPGRARLALAGLATALMVACRAVDIVFAVVLLAFVLARWPRQVGWFLPGPVVIGTALVGYNLAYFGTLSGGQAALEAMHPELHGVPGAWTANLLPGAAGTLFSPSRGLLIYCPWVLPAVALLPWTFRRLPSSHVLRPLIASLALVLAINSAYAVWWAGHSFGPRYWTDATPLLASALALALEWSARRFRGMVLILGLLVAWSVAVQAVGAFCYPSSWNLSPADVDRNHDRLWDWRDTEIRRCLVESST
jgi:hypothetical protein